MRKVLNSNYRICLKISLLLLLFTTSCTKNFLEKAPGSDIDINFVFSNKVNAEGLLWDTYGKCVPQGFPLYWDNDGFNGLYASMLAGASDEGDVATIWVGANTFNSGDWDPTINFEDPFGLHYKGIRYANIFLENIDKVTDATTAEKESYKAEAKVLRSIQYWELVKRYGGVPLVSKALEASGEIKLPRNTFEECVNFIVKDCDEAAAILPDAYSSNYFGRITKGAALSLKAEVLLYAASPLFNSTAPYMTGSSTLQGYGNFDQQRWKLAADASEAVLNWAGSNGIVLVNTSPDPATNYETAVTTPNNSEIILARNSFAWSATETGTYRAHLFLMPSGLYGSTNGTAVTLTQAMKYLKADGTDQTWTDHGTYADYKQKMAEMEPRFQLSVFWSGSKWNDEKGVIDFYTTAAGSKTPIQYFDNGVGYMRKFLTKFRAATGGGNINWPVFRLAEFYLDYAEALNEYSPADSRCYDAINVIKLRGGIPGISKTDPRYDTQEELREAIRRERAVELYAEEHRFFDVRRWKIAEQTENGPMYGWALKEQATNNLNSITYSKVTFETRVFQPKHYLYPFPQNEINKGYLVQNPGW